MTRGRGELSHDELDYYCETLGIAYGSLLELLQEIAPDPTDPRYERLSAVLLDAAARLRSLSRRDPTEDTPVISLDAKRHRIGQDPFAIPLELE